MRTKEASKPTLILINLQYKDVAETTPRTASINTCSSRRWEHQRNSSLKRTEEAQPHTKDTPNALKQPAAIEPHITSHQITPSFTPRLNRQRALKNIDLAPIPKTLNILCFCWLKHKTKELKTRTPHSSILFAATIFALSVSEFPADRTCDRI